MAGTIHHHHEKIPSFKTRQCFILFVIMVPCVLLGVGFYRNTTGRQIVIPEPRLLPNRNTNNNLGNDKNDNKHDRSGDNTKSAINRTEVSLENTLIRKNTYKKRLPECLIIGAKKGGTDAIRRFLNTHPNIVCHMRECHFFDKDENFNRGFSYYRKQMPYSYPDQITVEKSPEYFIKEIAVKRIYAFNEKMKVILTLRHPINRLISDYEHGKRWKKEPEISKRFEELVMNETGGINLNYEPINVSLYYIHLKMWLKYFPLEQIHIVDGDNFIENPVEEIEKIETYLGLPHKVTKDKVVFNPTKGFYCYIDGEKRKCLRKGKGHTFDPIDPEVYHKLFDFYKGYNEKLFALLGRKFKWEKEY